MFVGVSGSASVAHAICPCMCACGVILWQKSCQEGQRRSFQEGPTSAHVHAGVTAACPCDRTLRYWNDVFPCRTAARGLAGREHRRH